MSSRWANPINNNRLLDLENNVLLAGSLEFYEAGTSTALAVYSDPELTVNAGSILTADAFGQIEDFHMAAGTQYKVIAKDSLGAVKWTRDDVFSLDTSVDSRLDSVEAAINDSAASRNLLINGGMRVGDGVVRTLSSSFQEGVVNKSYGLVTNVTAGTLDQGASTTYRSGKYLKFDSVTTSGAGVVEAQIRVPSGTAANIVDTAAVFSAKVYHDVGSNITYTIKFQIPTGAADDFSSLSTLFTSSGQSVPTSTDTTISLSTGDMGDISKGLVIEISAAVGTLSGREFRITEAQLEPGEIATSFTETLFEIASKACGSDMPIGSIYENGVDGTNPTTLLGFGEWDAFGEGRVTIGAGTSSTDTNGDTITATAGNERGEFKHTQTIAEMPPHSFDVPAKSGQAFGSAIASSGNPAGTADSVPTNTLGSGTAMNNEQPSIVVYKWIRVG